ncbi:hypothetical protein [Blastopirellula marina]|uniref:DUF4412 domain-containing protein n=1 Tax=Blastopirellula marina TaxID=124 RepID=A0A2S8GB88_9BACT|nr:hypothetical protein [Blastopirellula marina]PQO41693.1 hypothetical protein C5Y98_02935 [Blastopirellula marina]PTL46136.1 hypothetical protein C5Y97_02935 [Blastopirellula marina]
MKTSLLATAVLAASVSLTSLCHATDFQVTTRVFDGNNPNPAMTLETVFHGDKVYDVVTTAPRQVTVIDFESGLVTLLDPQRQVKVTLQTQVILQHATYFKTQGNFPDDPVWNFLRDPKFTTQYDSEMKVLTMAGGPITYKAELDEIGEQTLADDYARFCDWSALLNFVTGIGGLPQARIDLNNQMKSKGAVPREIRKTVRNANPAKSVSARTTHDFQWQPNPKASQLIESIETDLKKSKAVSFEEFVKPMFAQK